MSTLIIALLLSVLAGLILFTLNQRFLALGDSALQAPVSGAASGVLRAIDLRPRHDHDILPRYIDLDVGDRIHVTKEDGETLELRILAVRIESRSTATPRTRVDFDVSGASYSAYCGALDKGQSGIGPIEIEGVNLAVEVTQLLFSKIKPGISPFNSYENLRLQGDLRLAIWEAGRRILRGVEGRFPLDTANRTGIGFSNWLRPTNYGIHSAIDIFSVEERLPERVLSPVDSVVYKVYNRDADPDDANRSKAINLYAREIVGPHGEKLLIRMQHLSEIFVSSGQFVRRGQLLGMTGHTGFDPRIGDHLHFEIRLNPSALGYDENGDIFASIPVNPYNYLREWYHAGQRRGDR